jgi:heme-degrading monooxygenase HmoA
MFAVIFEVQPRAARFEDYLGLARMLKPELERVEGFIDNERFASRQAEGRVLSLSTWRDEKALVRWRTVAAHHRVQAQGRDEILAHYHLRVGEISADSAARHALPAQRLDETETGAARALTLTEADPVDGQPALGDRVAALGLPAGGSAGLVSHEVFDSLYVPGKLLLLAAWTDAAAATRWQPAEDAKAAKGLRHRQVRVIRDYAMDDRREAPQFYPPVQATGMARPRAHDVRP